MNLSLAKPLIEIPGFGTINLNIENYINDTKDYFLMAVRKNNTKRNFLFVSQLLGKHIPINPDQLLDSCYKLSTLYAQDKNLEKGASNQFVCKEKTLVIGFAETATAMGHGVYDSFCGDCYYVHTTRDAVSHFEFAFEFEEEHCHATEQLFFLQKESWIKEAKEIIIVDDEVTTGKTIRNIIAQIEQYCPGKSYSVVTFLDWRNTENQQAYIRFSEEKNINIAFYSFVQGNIEAISVSDNTVVEELVKQPENYDAEGNGWKFHFLEIEENAITSAGNGIDVEQRAGINSIIDKAVLKVSPHLSGKKRAVIGTGEFMYIPLRCAKKFLGVNYFNATTRSPIIPYNHKDYGIKKAFHFVCPTDPGRDEYLYNSNVFECDEVVLFIEKYCPIEQLSSLFVNLDTAGYTSKHVVFIKQNHSDKKFQ